MNPMITSLRGRLIALAVLLVAIGIASLVARQARQPFRAEEAGRDVYAPAFAGRVTSVGDNSFQLEVPSSHEEIMFTVLVTRQTRIHVVNRSEPGAFSDITVGDTASVTPTANCSNSSCEAQFIDLFRARPQL